ncbi:MAG: hypothetical protein WCV84_05020 [Patescibacteria group bacterium]
MPIERAPIAPEQPLHTETIATTETPGAVEFTLSEGEATPDALMEEVLRSLQLDQPLNTKKLQALMQTVEDSAMLAYGPIESHTMDIITAEPCNLSALSRLLEIARVGHAYEKPVREACESRFGSFITHRLLTDRAYLASLEQISSTQQEKITDLIPLTKLGNLEEIIAMKEGIGDHPETLIHSMDATKYLAQPEALSYIPAEAGTVSPICRPMMTEYDERGLVKAVFEVRYVYEQKQAEQITDDVIECSRMVYIERNDAPSEPGQEPTMHVRVDHSRFNMPDKLIGKGTGRALYRACLKEYLDRGYDQISLHANIDIGCAAWASYGFGWDLEAMEKEGLTVEGVVENAKQKFQNQMQQLGLLRPNEEPTDPDIAEALAEFDHLLAHPELITPQLLANVGKPLFRRTKDKHWTTQAAVDALKGTEGYEQANAQLETRALTAGQLALITKGYDEKQQLLRTDWFGKIELKANQPQAGQNLGLLKKAIGYTE